MILCLVLGSLAMAQSNTGQLRGRVKDPQGAVINGATVTVTEQATGGKRETTTNDQGDFLVPLLPPGKYRVEVKANGFKNYTAENVQVLLTDTTQTEISLEVGSGEGDVVVVSSEAPLIRSDSPAQGRVVEERSIRQLPLPTRNFQQLLSLSAGATANISNTSEVGRGDTAINVNGQRTTSNSVLINGIDVNSIGTGSFANLAVIMAS
jgi:hypothetical protein